MENEKTAALLNELIRVNNRRAARFQKAAKALEGDEHKLVPVFNQLASESQDNVAQLATISQRLGGDVTEGTSVAGFLHGAWVEILSGTSFGDNSSILNECRNGEEEVKKAYKDALEPGNELTFEVAEVLRVQLKSISEGFGLIRPFLNPINNPGETSSSGLMELFVSELKGMLCAERELAESLPVFAKAAFAPELTEAFTTNQSETETQITRLEQALDIISLAPESLKCEAMSSILDEGDELISTTGEDTVQRDIGLIIFAKKAEHYEIASYSGIITLANLLGYGEIAELLSFTLEEERTADSKLSEMMKKYTIEESILSPTRHSDKGLYLCLGPLVYRRPFLI